MRARTNGIRYVFAAGMALLLLWAWVATRSATSPRAGQVSKLTSQEVESDQSASMTDPEHAAQPQRVSAAGEDLHASQEQELELGHVPGSRQFLPFELPDALENARRYAASTSFNPGSRSIEGAEADKLDNLIRSYNERIARANQEALHVLESAVTWKLDSYPADSSEVPSDQAHEHAWIVHRAYADGSRRRACILPGEYGMLDTACSRAQSAYLEGEVAIAAALIQAAR